MMIGKTISHYKILGKLGEGGMGKVFLAEDTILERKVALKCLSREMTSNKQSCKRFEREAKVAAALDHPNIVTVYEIDEFEGQTYIAMEYVAGDTLKEMRGMPIHTVIDIVIQICEGLEQAHHAGIIHRDIKPQNIIVDKNGRVKILDFGLAKLTGASRITQDIFRVGTSHYMSPEQARGDEVDRRTDIWSVGVVLYEMFTGQLPFRGEHEQATVYAVLNENPEPMTNLRTGVPRELERIVNKALAKDPSQRYRNTEDLIAALKTLKMGSEPEITPGTPCSRAHESVPGKSKRRKVK